MGCIAAGLAFGAAAVVGLPGAGAQEAPATLGSYDLRAGARGFMFYNADATGARSAEGEVPEASTTLATGPVGYGLASLAWPGALGGNAGSLLLVVAPDAPKEVSNLNYPVRAEARTGQSPDTTENATVPGTTMKATARPDLVNAESVVQGATGDPGEFGRTNVRSTTSLSEGKGIADAVSVVRNINLGEGAVTIDSITSTAKAVTDGQKGDGEARTIVSGVKVGGQPATIDENGLRFGDANQPANAIVNQLAQQALSEAGIEVVVSKPSKEVDGAGATVTAGSVVFTWTTPSGPNGIAFGGASASVNGGPGVDDLVAELTGDLGGAVGPDALPSGDLGSVGAAPLGGGLDAATPETGGGAPVADGDGEVALDATPAVELGGRRLKSGEVVFGLIAAALMAVGMRRLSNEVMAERAVATVCPLLEESP
jgi:hypothetical protein